MEQRAMAKKTFVGLLHGFRATTFPTAFVLAGLAASIPVAMTLIVAFEIDKAEKKGAKMNGNVRRFIYVLGAFVATTLTYALLFAFFGYGASQIEPSYDQLAAMLQKAKQSNRTIGEIMAGIDGK